MKIFISRQLKAGSPFLIHLEKQGHEVCGQSFLTFHPIAFEPPTQAQWLFFYSKRAVRYYFEQQTAAHQKLAAIGPSTAQAIQTATGRSADFIGQGEAEEIARAFTRELDNDLVAFLRARRSRKSVQLLLPSPDQIIDCIIYDNQKQTEVPQQNADILVFTSPMNAEAYFAQYALAEQQQIVAIGQTTAAALAALHIHCSIAPAPTEDAMAKVVLELIESSS